MLFVIGMMCFILGLLMLLPGVTNGPPTPRTGFGVIMACVGASLMVLSVGMFLWRVMP
jgi:hypothetical protein